MSNNEDQNVNHNLNNNKELKNNNKQINNNEDNKSEIIAKSKKPVLKTKQKPMFKTKYENQLNKIKNKNNINNDKNINKAGYAMNYKKRKKFNNIDNESTSSETKSKISYKNYPKSAKNRQTENAQTKFNKKNNNKKNIDITQISFNNDDISDILNNKIGFVNLGNSCFMNTCLQNLIHSEYFIKNLFSKKNLVSKNTPITYHFIKLLSELIQNKNVKSISPKEFKEIFANKHPIFKGPRQQDTQEFCRFLLEDINQELNEIKEKPYYIELSTINKTKVECNKEYDENFRSRENSIIIECFYSQIINIFICKCGYETYSFQKILDFPLLLKKDCKKTELNNLLKIYFENKDVPFETECEKCQKKEVHKKIIKFTQIPNILILSLQRRNEKTGNKNNCILKFPEQLDISEYIDEECGDKKECKYSLYGIGNHFGDFSSGHFSAYIKLNDNKWYEFNDSKVSQYLKVIESSSTAYLLFYKKI